VWLKREVDLAVKVCVQKGSGILRQNALIKILLGMVPTESHAKF